MKSLHELLLWGVEAGHWSVEDLDHPPSGWPNNAGRPRNLLRDAPPAEERVQVIDDKDLPPLPHGITPAQGPDLPLAEPPEPETPYCPF